MVEDHKAASLQHLVNR